MRTLLPRKPDSTSGGGLRSDSTSTCLEKTRKIRVLGNLRSCRLRCGRPLSCPRHDVSHPSDPTSGKAPLDAGSCRPDPTSARDAAHFQPAWCFGSGHIALNAVDRTLLPSNPCPGSRPNRSLNLRSRASGDRRPADPTDRGSDPSRRPRHGPRGRPRGQALDSL